MLDSRCIPLFFVFLLFVSSAHADNKTAARAAALAGVAEYEAGQYENALKRLERAEELLHAPPHLLYIARARAKLGKLVAAREAYLSLIHETLPDNSPQPFKDAQQTAQVELAELEPRIPRLVVEIDGGDDAELVLNGESIGSGLIGIPYPIDPGTHVIRAELGETRSAETEVRIEEGVQKKVTLVLESIAGPPGDDDAIQQADVRKVRVDSVEPRSSVRPLLIYGGFGLGAVGLGAGAVTGLMALGEVKSVKSDFDCDGDGVCDDSGSKDELRAARTLEVVSTVGFALGAVGVGLGIYGLLMDDGKRGAEQAKSSRVVPLLGETNGLAISGVF